MFKLLIRLTSAAPIIVIVEQHTRIADKNERQRLVFAGAYSLLVNLMVRRFPSIKPCFGTNLARHRIVGLSTVDDAKGEAFGVEFVPRKPSRRYAWRAREPFATLAAMTNEQGREVIPFDEANS